MGVLDFFVAQFFLSSCSHFKKKHLIGYFCSHFSPGTSDIGVGWCRLTIIYAAVLGRRWDGGEKWMGGSLCEWYGSVRKICLVRGKYVSWETH